MSSYQPTAVPSDAPSGLRAWLAAQFRQIADALSNPTVVGVRFSILNAEPARYANGDVVYADGTNWNPGSGAGVYARVSGAWTKL